MPLYRVTLSHSQDDLALCEPLNLDIQAVSAAGALVMALAAHAKGESIKHLRAHVQRLPEKGEIAYREPPCRHGCHTGR